MKKTKDQKYLANFLEGLISLSPILFSLNTNTLIIIIQQQSFYVTITLLFYKIFRTGLGLLGSV